MEQVTQPEPDEVDDSSDNDSVDYEVDMDPFSDDNTR